MPIQLSVSVRNGRADSFETVVGASPTLEIRTGAQPANCAAADTGTVLATIALPADWMAAASGGSKSLSGTWQDASADGTGVAGHFRIKQGATCHMQGSVGSNQIIVTNALTAANGNVLNFGSTTGIVVGQTISGTGIPAGATVIATTATTVTMSLSSTAGVANGASITFGFDMSVDNVNFATGQQFTVNSFTITEGNA
jgi:hypothetical protein